MVKIKSINYKINPQIIIFQVQQSPLMEIQIENIEKLISNQHYTKPFKSIVLITLSAIFLIYRLAYEFSNDKCINDVYQNATQDINRQLVLQSGSSFQGNSNQLSVTGKGFIGTGQVLMDLWIAILGIIWIWKIQNMRALFALAAFYLSRGIILLNIERFPYPNDMAWRSPGFFSAVVPYDHTRDFFNSGHTGGLLVCVAEMFTLRYTKLGIFGVLSLLYMMNMLVTTKVHYVIDVIGGLIYSIWFYRLAIQGVQKFDRLASLPFLLWIKITECLKPEEEGIEKTDSAKSQTNEQLSKNIKPAKQNSPQPEIMNQQMQQPEIINEQLN